MNLDSKENISLTSSIESALKDSEQRYRELFESVTDMVYIHDLALKGSIECHSKHW